MSKKETFQEKLDRNPCCSCPKKVRDPKLEPLTSSKPQSPGDEWIFSLCYRSGNFCEAHWEWFKEVFPDIVVERVRRYR